MVWVRGKFSGGKSPGGMSAFVDQGVVRQGTSVE